MGLCLATKSVDLQRRNLGAIESIVFCIAYVYDVVVKKVHIRYLIS